MTGVRVRRKQRVDWFLLKAANGKIADEDAQKAAKGRCPVCYDNILNCLKKEKRYLESHPE